jgi:small subunit ribosomal protein S20
LLRSKSGQKAARSSKKKQARNRSLKSATKTYVAKAENLVQEKKGESAAAVKQAFSMLDKSAKKNVIHANTASRKKSRLMKKLNKAAITVTAEKEPTKKPVAKSKKKTTKSQN